GNENVAVAVGELCDGLLTDDFAGMPDERRHGEVADRLPELRRRRLDHLFVIGPQAEIQPGVRLCWGRHEILRRCLEFAFSFYHVVRQFATPRCAPSGAGLDAAAPAAECRPSI